MAQASDLISFGSEWPTSELVHSEPLVDRSQLYDWQIRPHRHDDLVQLFLLLEGGGRARLDSVWHELAAPCLLIIPERCVHEFEWDRASQGYVLSIRSGLVKAMAERVEPLRSAFDEVANINLANTDRFISELITAIHHESRGNRPFKDVALDSMIRVLATWLARQSAGQSATAGLRGRSGKHFARFTRLVDERHKSHSSVADYAQALGITPSHLNTVCQHQAGRTALEVVHERLVLAARRELTYTERNIAGVAYHLGFADPSYFTRFFKRETGMTPGQYRRRSGTHDSGMPAR